jgi:hypothetical protein
MKTLSNPELFSYKKKLLKNLDKCKNENSQTISIDYHGLKLNIFSDDKKLIDEIECQLPANWRITFNSRNVNINHFSLKSLGISSEYFTDESSQDCFTSDFNTEAIQRDFLAKIINERNVSLICEPELGDGFYNFLRWFISEKLIQVNKFVLHCAAVLDESQKAHLFLGHSGAGKSTISFLSLPKIILGDDMNIISLNENEEVVVEAGAIGGAIQSHLQYNTQYLVKGIYWIVQSERNDLERLSESLSLSKLIASYANLNWQTSTADLEDKLLSFSQVIVSKIPVQELKFKRDDSFWNLLN